MAENNGLAIGAAGTHPAALYEDQLIVDRPRYKELAAELSWIAEQELIFGTHVHVGIDDAEKAIYVADGMRGYLPLLLGMSSNSPLWRGKTTGMMSSRTPVFRAFPRVGIPPYYGTWDIYSHRVEQMMRGGAIPDYTYLWWDVRPHPNLGTVELRVFDQQTHIEHTIGFAALGAGSGAPPRRRLRRGRAEHRASPRADRRQQGQGGGGRDRGEADRLRSRPRGPRGKTMARGVIDDLREHASELGCEAELAILGDLTENGTGARRQLDWLSDHGEIGGPDARDRRRQRSGRMKIGRESNLFRERSVRFP